jgi:imidazoleglycerol phosphate synthase glutamine amidotransferase subunit HisH
VTEEGFSFADYYQGFKYLIQDKENIQHIDALCLPGVGDTKILDASELVRQTHKSFLITNQKDLYDYLTSL